MAGQVSKVDSVVKILFSGGGWEFYENRVCRHVNGVAVKWRVKDGMLCWDHPRWGEHSDSVPERVQAAYRAYLATLVVGE